MKTKHIIFVIITLAPGLALSSCSPKETDPADTNIVLKDHGRAPAVLNIDAHTLGNTHFRTALWTGEKMQITLMSIPAGGEVGLEQHKQTEQFLRIEEGEARVLIGDKKDALDYSQAAREDFAIFIPAGKWHNIINTGNGPLKLYSIYTPPEHTHGTIHKTRQESDAAEHHH